MKTLQSPRTVQGAVERKCEHHGCSNRFFVPKNFVQNVEEIERLPEHERQDSLRALYGQHEGFFCGASGDVYCSDRCYDFKYGE